MTWRELCRGASLEFGETRLEGSLEHIPGKNALVLYFKHGDAEVLSVDLLGAGYVPRPDEVFVRDYSEHAGLPAALVRTGCFEHLEDVPLGSFGTFAARLRVRSQDELTAAVPEAALTISAAPDGDDAVIVREAATGRALRIQRDDADPEHRLVAYRVAAGWFGNLPGRTPAS